MPQEILIFFKELFSVLPINRILQDDLASVKSLKVVNFRGKLVNPKLSMFYILLRCSSTPKFHKINFIYVLRTLRKGYKLAKSPLIIGEEGEEYALFIIRKSGDGLKLKISQDS